MALPFDLDLDTGIKRMAFVDPRLRITASSTEYMAFAESFS